MTKKELEKEKYKKSIFDSALEEEFYNHLKTWKGIKNINVKPEPIKLIEKFSNGYSNFREGISEPDFEFEYNGKTFVVELKGHMIEKNKTFKYKYTALKLWEQGKIFIRVHYKKWKYQNYEKFMLLSEFNKIKKWPWNCLTLKESLDGASLSKKDKELRKQEWDINLKNYNQNKIDRLNDHIKHSEGIIERSRKLIKENKRVVSSTKQITKHKKLIKEYQEKLNKLSN